MPRTGSFGARIFKRPMDRVAQNLGYSQRGNDLALRIPNFNTCFTKRYSAIHELPNKIPGTVFDLGQCVFEMGEIHAFFVPGHAIFITKIDEIAGHGGIYSEQLDLTL